MANCEHLADLRTKVERLKSTVDVAQSKVPANVYGEVMIARLESFSDAYAAVIDMIDGVESDR